MGFHAFVRRLLCSIVLLAAASVYTQTVAPSFPNPGKTSMSKDQQTGLGLEAAGQVFQQMPVLPGVVMEGYRERMRKHVEGMRNCAAANHVDYEMLTTKQPLDFALFSFLSRRAGK